MKKTNNNRTLCIISALLLAAFSLCLLSACGNTGGKATGDFTTTENPDGSLLITEYKGDGGAVSIPATIEGKSVTGIGEYAFMNCKSITSVVIPGSIKSVGMSAFSDCKNINSITISEGVAEIGKYAFRRCMGITSVTIPKSVTSLGEDVFYGCFKLVQITDLSGSINGSTQPNIEQELRTNASTPFANILATDSDGLVTYQTKDKKYALGYSGSAATLDMTGKGITDISTYAFSGCGALTSVIIPDSVTFIGAFAFSDCSSLTSATFQNTSGWKAGLTAVDVSDAKSAADDLTDIILGSSKWTCPDYQ